MSEKKTINEKIKILEENARALESNRLDLEEALDIYQRSLKLIKECDEELNNVRNTIKVLTPENIEVEVDEELVQQ